MCSVPELHYTVHEHDRAKPWLVVGEIRHLTVELDEASEFATWAAESWPHDRYTAELDPGQERQRLNR
jgi:hypothetical protein